MRIVTIGGYGFDEETFFGALRNAEVDVFVDVRQRRGLRGRKYAFLNSSRLQAELEVAGIRYVHIRELAPTTEIRDLQKRQDAATHTEKRARQRLAPAFVEAYRRDILAGYDASDFARAVGPDARVVALFCVEGQPEACHRSLVAEQLASETGARVEHLEP